MTPPRKEKVEKLLGYINAYWHCIKREHNEDSGTLLGLPHPYFVPNSRGEGMFQEMYYWDSFFTALGLNGTEYEEYSVYMTQNLAALFNRLGIIPNGSRYYFTSRSQPPFFTKLMRLAYNFLKDRGRDDEAEQFLAEMTAVAEKEHNQVWMGSDRLVLKSSSDVGLSRYFDINYLHDLACCESGWDHSTRCDDRWLDHIPVDLNSILYARERDIAKAKRILGDDEAAAQWKKRAKRRKKLMYEYLWDGDRHFFFDYNYETNKRNPHLSLAGFYPLWARLVEAEQAETLVRKWLPVFEHQGGLVTSLEPREEKQWAFPNGWAPLQWIVVEGLENYGYSQDAMRIRHKWCQNCIDVYERGIEVKDEEGHTETRHALWEKYNVVNISEQAGDGCYGAAVEGFGWSNAIFKVFAEHPQFFDSQES